MSPAPPAPRHRPHPRAEDLVVTRWCARFRGRRFPVATGRGGIAEKRREGDGVTPRGILGLAARLFRPDRAPATARPAGRASAAARPAGRPIGLRLGWSDDPADPAYNRPVRRPHRFSHEALRRPDGQYDLLAVTDWNAAPPVPGAGSAIFLHVWRRPRHPTAGCIAFRARDLRWILGRWTPRSRVIVR